MASCKACGDEFNPQKRCASLAKRGWRYVTVSWRIAESVLTSCFAG